MKLCSRGDKCLHGNPMQPYENFSKRAASKDGLSYLCKTCERAVAAASYKRRKAKKAQHDRYLANRDAILARSREHYEKNREMRLAQAADYRKANPEVARRSNARRRQKLKQVESEPYTRQEIIERDSVNGVPICQICKEPIYDLSKLHIDHRVPVDKGGADAPHNVRVACENCNLRRPKDGRDLKTEGERL